MAGDRVTVTVSETVQVQRTPEEVFDYTQDYATRSDWDASVSEAEVLSEEPRRVKVNVRGVGRMTIEYQLFRRGDRTSAAFTEIDSRYFTRGGGSWSYVARDGGTEWTQTNTLDLKPGLMGRVNGADGPTQPGLRDALGDGQGKDDHGDARRPARARGASPGSARRRRRSRNPGRARTPAARRSSRPRAASGPDTPRPPRSRARRGRGRPPRRVPARGRCARASAVEAMHVMTAGSGASGSCGYSSRSRDARGYADSGPNWQYATGSSSASSTLAYEPNMPRPRSSSASLRGTPSRSGRSRCAVGANGLSSGTAKRSSVAANGSPTGCRDAGANGFGSSSEPAARKGCRPAPSAALAAGAATSSHDGRLVFEPRSASSQ